MADRFLRWLVLMMVGFIVFIIAYGSMMARANGQEFFGNHRLEAYATFGDPCDDLSTKYVDAYQRAIIEEKPLLVLLVGPRCDACEAFKRDVIQPMRRRGELSQVVLAIVDREEDSTVWNAIKSQQKIATVPALILYFQGKVIAAKSPKNRGTIERLFRDAAIVPTSRR